MIKNNSPRASLRSSAAALFSRILNGQMLAFAGGQATGRVTRRMEASACGQTAGRIPLPVEIEDETTRRVRTPARGLARGGIARRFDLPHIHVLLGFITELHVHTVNRITRTGACGPAQFHIHAMHRVALGRAFLRLWIPAAHRDLFHHRGVGGAREFHVHRVQAFFALQLTIVTAAIKGMPRSNV